MADGRQGFSASTQLLGRQSERAILDGLLDRISGGTSGVLVMRGEAGIGKTALLRYLAGRAVGFGFTVARYVGVESEMEFAFAGLHDLCTPVLDKLDSLVEPQRRALSVALGLASGDRPDPFLVALATLSLLAEASVRRPILCVVDDAQWLDQGSAQILGAVGRRLLAEPVALVFAARTPVTSPDRLAGLPELELAGLDELSAHALLASVAPGRLDESIRSRIIEESQGNALALLEFGASLGRADLAGGFAMPDTASIPRRIQDQFLTRLAELPDEAQRLLLVASADPVGDRALLQRAAHTLGLSIDSLDPAVDAGLLRVETGVRFRHPLLRSAVYRAATAEDRRAAHAALAAATDPEAEPDRRAWHSAYAASGPDEDVAAELIRSADRATQRGGVAAAAAFWERAVTLSPDPGLRASRALAAAEAKYAAADFVAAQKLLAAADIGPLDELGRAQAEHMGARIAFALNRGGETPALLLRTAQRLQPLDADQALETLLESLVAAVYAGRLAVGGDISDVARVAKSAPLGPEPVPHPRLLLRGLAMRVLDGYDAAAPVLKEALRQYRAQPRELDALCDPYSLVAIELWDDDACFELASGQARLARSSGNLSWLPYALLRLALIVLQAGDITQAEGLITEAQCIDPVGGTASRPAMALRVAAWRGDSSTASELIAAVVADASRQGQGAVLTYADYIRALLHNGLADYSTAAAAAHRAASVDQLTISQYARYELVEAAVRSDQTDWAHAASERLSATAAASGTDWARGVAAHARALLADGDTADGLYREAIELLSRTRVTAYLARTRLCYGEFLRRTKRRADARAQLRPAFEALIAMGANGFAERARRELAATGETVRTRGEDQSTTLTAQEERISELARQGRTNPEIGAQLFLSARTVEWHLGNIFAKLEISSRRELDAALTSRGRAHNGPLRGDRL